MTYSTNAAAAVSVLLLQLVLRLVAVEEAVSLI